MIKNWFGVVDFLPKVISIFTAGILARKLGPELYASWSLLLGVQLLLLNLSSMGFTTSMQRLLPSMNIKRKNYYLFTSLAINFFLNVVFFVGLFLYGSELVKYYKLPLKVLPLVYFLTALSFVTCIEITLDTYLKINEDIKKFSKFVVFRTLIEIAALLYFFKISSEAVSVYLILNYVLIMLVLKVLIYLSMLFPYLRDISFSEFKNLRFYLVYGVPTVVASLVLWGFGNLDRVVLTRYMTLNELGSYSFGASLATYIAYIGPIIVPLLMPRLSFLYDQGHSAEMKQMENYFNKNLKCFILCVGGVWIFLSLFHKELILITAGQEYLNASKALFFLALYYGIDQIFGLWAYIFHLRKKPFLLTIFRISFLFCYIGGLAIFLAHYSASRIYFAILGLGVVYNLMLYLIAQNLASIRMSFENAIIFASIGIISLMNYYFGADLPFLVKCSFLIILGSIFSFFMIREYIGMERYYEMLKKELTEFSSV